MLRPGDFPTSLDLLRQQGKGLGREHADALNRRFWDLLDATDLEGTNVAVAYMQGDDYDATAYEDLMSHLRKKHVRVAAKGIIGRHNDNTREVVKWFQRRYLQVLREDFGRECI